MQWYKLGDYLNGWLCFESKVLFDLAVGENELIPRMLITPSYEKGPFKISMALVPNCLEIHNDNKQEPMAFFGSRWTILAKRYFYAWPITYGTFSRQNKKRV